MRRNNERSRKSPARRYVFQAEPLEERRLLAADPIISEFMASNNDTLLDGNGNSSDWIEIYNAGDEAVDLAGWTLSDDPREPDKWSFPTGVAVLAPNQFLVVFASGDDQPDSDGNLHTNFQLSADGEYVGLYDPDENLANQFPQSFDDGLDYPPQRDDVSYGLSGGFLSSTVVDPTSAARYLIPTADSYPGNDWTAVSFDDTNGFTSGQAAIGFETNSRSSTAYTNYIQTPVPSGTTNVLTRIPFELASTDNIVGIQLDLQFDDGFVAFLNGAKIASVNAPTTLAFNSVATASYADSLAIEGTTFDINEFADRLVVGNNVLAIHALNQSNSSSDFLISPQLQIIETTGEDSTGASYMATPTPGGPNAEGFLGFVDEVAFSHERGFYDAPFDLQLTTTTADADIYYTLDGSDPTPATGIRYESPIAISNVATVRAVAIRDNFEPSESTTQTYVFYDSVFNQDPRQDSPNGLTYPITWQGGFTGDYEVDTRVIDQWNDENPANTDFGIREALTSIPSISLVLDHDDLWDSSSGIYPNATSSGSAWRRPGSVEYFDPATGEQFQYNIGIQMQGAASRDNNRLLKHSFRLVFQDEFGPGRLNFPLFDNSDFDDINTVSLKASFTDSFATRSVTNRYSPLDSLYMRDVWMRDTQIAMGHASADSTYVHLYINGLYWGLYWPSERVDDAFLSSRLGGEREDWDVVRDFNELFRGNRNAYDEMFRISRQLDRASDSEADRLFHTLQGLGENGQADPSTEALLDVDNFIDYMILHLYGGVEDWPSHNWYAARNRVDPGKGFQFFTWDQEISLDQLFRDRTEASNSSTPGELFQNMSNSPAFRLRFADRVQIHLFNDGALTPENSRERFLERADQIEAAIIGESARWGDAKEGDRVTPYTSLGALGEGIIPRGQQTIPLMTVDHWRDARDYVHDTFFENAGDLLISRLQSDQLYPTTNAPELSINGTLQHGGLVVDGDVLSISASDVVYFTTDGTDPRRTDGTIGGTVFSGDISLSSSVEIKARTLQRGRWSALTTATFTVGSGGIVISEINYHPADATNAAESPFDDDDFEFIEIANTNATQSINLVGMRLDDAVRFTFGNTTLTPGERVVVVRDTDAFRARYGDGARIVGEYDGGLSNSDERIVLLDGAGQQTMSISYSDSFPWSSFADGAGATLELADPSGTPANELGEDQRWQHSFAFGGTPGSIQINAPLPIQINEVASNPSGSQPDSIELHNPSDAPITIGGWYLSDSRSDLLKYQIPAGTVLASGEYIVFDENDFNDPDSPTPDKNFALNGSLGDDVYLVVGDPNTNGASLFIDSVSFGPSFEGESYGRYQDGTGRLTPLSTPTPGMPNALPETSSVVISEIHYHPAAPSDQALQLDPSLTEADLEFIEIHNASTEAANLTDWRLRGEADFEFADGTTLPALQSFIVVSFDPNDVANANKLAAFQTQFAAANAVVLGPYRGQLSNGGGNVVLQQPDTASGLAIPPYVPRDQVDYNDVSPWDPAADGAGPSLHRTGPTAYANDPANWISLAPSPGTVDFVPLITGDYNRDGFVDQGDWLVWSTSFNSTRAVNADGNGDGFVDAADFTIWRDNLQNSATSATAASFHNDSMAADVNGDGIVSPLDALLLINQLNSETVAEPEHWSPDVSGDGWLSIVDAAFVMDALNSDSLSFELVDDEEEG